jgi:preprotein translocase subunit SecA
MNSETQDSESVIDEIEQLALQRYDAREQELGEDIMGALERFLLLQTIDERWREHLYDMDYLREGIGLRQIAQMDPLIAYKNEAFELFGDLMNSVWTDFTRMIFNVRVNVEGQGVGGPQTPGFAASGSSTKAGRVSYSGGSSAMGAGAIAAAAASQGGAQAQAGASEQPENYVEQRVIDTEHQVGRNDPCWCGSGKKFKKCHGA